MCRSDYVFIKRQIEEVIAKKRTLDELAAYESSVHSSKLSDEVKHWLFRAIDAHRSDIETVCPIAECSEIKLEELK